MRIGKKTDRHVRWPLACLAVAAVLFTGVTSSGMSVLASPVIEGAQEGRVVIMRPAEALEVLAMARELNRRCHFMPGVAEELGSYAARAEIATAAQEGAEAAKTALEIAKEEAAGMACDEDARDLVTAALEAAREAARQAGIAVAQGPSIVTPVPQPRKPVGDRAAARQVRVAKTAPVERLSHSRDSSRRSVNAAMKQGTHTLGRAHQARPERASRKAATNGRVRRLAQRYERLAGTYYLDLRCKRLPYARARRLWQQVKALHYRLLDEGGPAVLLTAKRRARAMANRRSCASLRLAGR